MRALKSPWNHQYGQTWIIKFSPRVLRIECVCGQENKYSFFQTGGDFTLSNYQGVSSWILIGHPSSFFFFGRSAGVRSNRETLSLENHEVRSRNCQMTNLLEKSHRLKPNFNVVLKMKVIVCNLTNLPIALMSNVQLLWCIPVKKELIVINYLASKMKIGLFLKLGQTSGRTFRKWMQNILWHYGRKRPAATQISSFDNCCSIWALLQW